MDSCSVKCAVRFLDEFFHSVAQFIAEFEKQLSKYCQLAPHPSAGNRTTWSVSGSILYPEAWILKNLHRVYVPKTDRPANEARTSSALVCLLSLYPEGLFEEPALLCARLDFPTELTYEDVYSQAWKSALFSTIDCADSSCRSIKLDANGRYATLEFRDKSNPTKSIDIFALDITNAANRSEVAEKFIGPVATLMKRDEPELSQALKFPAALVDAWKR